MNVEGHVQSTVMELGRWICIGSSKNNAQKTELSHPNVIWMENLDMSAEETNTWVKNNPTVLKVLN